MILTTDIQAPQCRRGTEFEKPERAELAELVDRYGITNVARAADCSVQSVAKALSGMKLYESTKRRLRKVLRQP